ncbi:MAG: hypothetical protein GW886_10405 [Rhodobacterales bacterium]|nr:hypothetical protein [Rhodobacterales bacterium]NCT13460.1 hypothetical protein [Rhodobacterales bacterium]
MPFFEMAGEDIVILPGKIRDRLAGEMCDTEGHILPPDGTMTFISFGFHTATILSSQRFKAHRHWRATSFPDRAPVSDGVFAAMVLDLNAEALTFLKIMAARGHSLAVLSSPPPTRRFGLLKSGHSEADILMLDALVRETMAGAISALGIAVVAPPADVAPDGFLRPDLMNADENDTHHGNPKYGELVLRDLAARCGVAPS